MIVFFLENDGQNTFSLKDTSSIDYSDYQNGWASYLNKSGKKKLELDKWSFQKYIKNDQLIGTPSMSIRETNEDNREFWHEMDKSGKKQIIYPFNINSDNKEDVQYIKIEAEDPKGELKTVASQKQGQKGDEFKNGLASQSNLIKLYDKIVLDRKFNLNCPNGFNLATEQPNGDIVEWNKTRKGKSVCVTCSFRYDSETHTSINSVLTLISGVYFCVWPDIDQSAENRVEIKIGDDNEISASSVFKLAYNGELVDIPNYDTESSIDISSTCDWDEIGDWDDSVQAYRSGANEFAWYTSYEQLYTEAYNGFFSQFLLYATKDSDGNIVPKNSGNWPSEFKEQDINFIVNNCSLVLSQSQGKLQGHMQNCYGSGSSPNGTRLADFLLKQTNQEWVNHELLFKRHYRCQCNYNDIPLGRRRFYEQKNLSLKDYYNSYIVDDYGTIKCVIPRVLRSSFCRAQGLVDITLPREDLNVFKCTWKAEMEVIDATRTLEILYNIGSTN